MTTGEGVFWLAVFAALGALLFVHAVSAAAVLFTVAFVVFSRP